MEMERGQYNPDVHIHRLYVLKKNLHLIAHVSDPTVFSALQTYAIYGKDKRVFFILVILGALNPILNIVNLLSPSPPFMY